MKYTKLYLSLLAAFAFAAVSCDKTEVPEYEPAPGISSEQVFFPASVGDQIKIADGETSFTVPVWRGTANLEAMDVEISASGEGIEYFTIPGVVSFAAQSKTADLTITVTDVEELGKNNFYEITLSIADASLTTPYGRSSVTFTAGIELPWIKFDSGTYYNWWNDEEIERTMEYQEISETMRLCRVQDYWDDEEDPFDIFWYWNTETNHCFVLPTVLGGYDGSNNVVISDMASFYTKYNGWESEPTVGPIGSDTWFAWAGPWMASRDDIPYYDGNGTFYLADWFYIADAETGVPTGSGWQFGGGDGDWFKGKSFGDYSLTVSYDGMHVSPAGTASPILGFYSTKESAKYYSTVKYVITDQETDASETLDAMVAGKCEEEATIALTGGSASVMLNIEPGLYRVVAVPFVDGDKNDEGESTEYKLLFAETIDFYFPGLQAEVKEVEGDIMLMSVEELIPEESREENGYYDYNSIGYVIEGKEIKSGIRGLFNASVLDNFPMETILANCSAIPDATIASINENGYYAGAFINLDAETEYAFIVELTNVYCSSKVFTATYTTGQMPYDGELVVGDYVIRGSEDANLITLLPTEEDDVFFVKNLGIEDGSLWYGYYDSDASTLTLSGELKGYEQYGNLFGAGIYYFDAEGTMYYATCVYDSEYSYGDDELVFDVDASTKQLCKINQDIEIAVFSDEDDSYLGYYSYLEAGSPVSLYTAGAAKASVKPAKASGYLKQMDRDRKVRHIDVKVPYRMGYSDEVSVKGAVSFRPTLSSKKVAEGWGSDSQRVKKARNQQLITFDPAK